MLLDAKSCQGTRFPLSRVEPNQRACFLLAESRGNHELGLIVWFEPLQEFRLIPWQSIKEANEAGKCSISAEEAIPL
jgi:penicillin-binding protein-related factor A (putative recombinase)